MKDIQGMGFLLRGELQVKRLCFPSDEEYCPAYKEERPPKTTIFAQQQKSPNNSVIGYLTEINQILLGCKSSLKISIALQWKIKQRLSTLGQGLNWPCLPRPRGVFPLSSAGTELSTGKVPKHC